MLPVLSVASEVGFVMLTDFVEGLAIGADIAPYCYGKHLWIEMMKFEDFYGLEWLRMLHANN